MIRRKHLALAFFLLLYVFAVACQPCQNLHFIFQWIAGPFAFENVNCNKPTHVQSVLGDETEEKQILQKYTISRWPDYVSNLKNRMSRQISISVAAECDYALELRWVPFRGNMKLVQLGMNGQQLIILPGQSVVQYTHVGHLFVVLRVGKTIDPTQTPVHSLDLFEQLEVDIDNIIGMYFIPFNMKDTSIIYGPGYSSTVNLDKLMETASKECQRHKEDTSTNLSSSCYRELLLIYWEYQRLSQVPIHTWAVPIIPTNADRAVAIDPQPGDIARVSLKERRLNTDMDNGIKNKNVMQRPFVTSSGSSTSRLWRLELLSETLTEALHQWYVSNRVSPGISTEEPPISMVFNQIESRTYYVPLPSHLLDSVSKEVHLLSSAWLDLLPNELELTGAYGGREYRTGAVVRWHVDPVESQPITAIIHLADSQEASTSGWALQIPKSLEDFWDYDISAISKNGFNLFSPKAVNSTVTGDKVGDVEGDHGSDPVDDFDRLESIYLRPGQVLLLQSAKLPHARLLPLTGDWYANAFIHFRPKNWDTQSCVRALT